MKPEIKELWLNALKSGEYKRGTGSLRKKVGKEIHHCCLGVLVDLFCKEKGLEFNHVDNPKWGYWGLIPTSVCEWAEIKETDGHIIGVSCEITLSKLNDASNPLCEPDLEKRDYSYNCVIPVIEKL